MKIKKLLGLVFLTASLGAMLSSCSSYSLLYDQVYNAAELESFHTFRIVTPEDGSLPPGMSIATYYNVAAALRQQMTERGYTEDPASDLLVNIGLTVRKELVNVPYTQTVQTGGSYLPACFTTGTQWNGTVFHVPTLLLCTSLFDLYTMGTDAVPRRGDDY